MKPSLAPETLDAADLKTPHAHCDQHAQRLWLASCNVGRGRLYLDEVLPGGKARDQAVPPGPGVGDRDVQAVVGQLVHVGGENRLNSAPGGGKGSGLQDCTPSGL